MDATTLSSGAEGARAIWSSWDSHWDSLCRKTRDRGLDVLCAPGCTPCCYARTECSLAEAAAIEEHLHAHFTPKEQEVFWTRVHSTASSLRRLAREGLDRSEDAFFASGGLECPFLQRGRCAIYEVRPLHCRALFVTNDNEVQSCGRCPCAVNDTEAEIVRRAHHDQLRALDAAFSDAGDRLFRQLSDALCEVWELAPPQSNDLLVLGARRHRLASQGSSWDRTWQDDRSDFRVMLTPLGIPQEGDYEPDLTLVRHRPAEQQLYGEVLDGKGLPESHALYQREEGCRFDWSSRRFVWDEAKLEGLPYTVWMSDAAQERLMMWEGAKRVRGRVLCGGLGLGIFPQLALGIGRVDRIDVVESDRGVIDLVEGAWRTRPWPGLQRCSIVHDTIEAHLATTNERYDAVYLDTWDALYWEYLPHVTRLAHAATRVLRPDGEVLVWGFDLMLRQFLQLARLLGQSSAAAGPERGGDDTFPLFARLVRWAKSHEGCGEPQLLAEAYRLAIESSWELGKLKMVAGRGAQQVLMAQAVASYRG